MPAFVSLNPVTPHSHTVIFLHGRGSTASALSESLFDSRDSYGRDFRDLFPTFRWVFPQASACRPAAFAQDLRTQWFDVWNARDLTDREELQGEGLRASVKAIQSIITEEAEKLGGKTERLILVGISQGASTAIHTLLQLDHLLPVGHMSSKLGALIGFCGRLPFAGRSLVETRLMLDPANTSGRNEILRNTPILLEHSINDPLAKVEDGRVLRDAMIDFGADVEWVEYPDGGHWIQSPEGVENAAAFLRRTLNLAVGDT